ncbi:putative Ig domain-containing protein [Aurantiacibacter flavus]|uniref:Ig domain-containing protein n=1 Tax=Aurantiacibacter flavus TaxID=3145232 RepID=A0ABV0D1J6_9SPHN
MKNKDIAKDDQAVPANGAPAEVAKAAMSPVPVAAPRHPNADGGQLAGRQRAPQSLLDKISAKAAEQRLSDEDEEDEDDLAEQTGADAEAEAAEEGASDEAPADSVDAGTATAATQDATEQTEERTDTPLDGNSNGFLSGVPPIVYALGAAGIVGGGIAIFRSDGGSTIAAPEAKLNSDTGASATDFITKDGTIDVSGLVTGNTWEYSTDGGTSWTAGSGSSFTLAEGTYAAGSIQVRQKDTGGQTGEVGKIAGAVTVDETAPSAPAINAVAGDDVIDRDEAEAPVSVSGTGEAGSALTVKWGAVSKAVTVNQDGTWTAEFAANEVPANGDYAITASAVDVAGNVSETATHDVVVDRQSYISGTVSAGPVVAGLQVKAYTEDGTLLASGVTDDTGSFRIGYADYTGLILVSVVDPQTDSQGFLDEATGQQSDLTVMLRAVKSVTAGEDVVINITPLTEVATRLMGGSLNSTGETDLSGVSATDVTNANAFVAKLFTDLSDVVLTNQDLKLVIDATGADISDTASVYGVYLAAIQGWTLKQGQTLEETIEEIVVLLQGHQSLGSAITRPDLGLTDAQKLADILEQGFENVVAENQNLASALLPAVTVKALGFVNDDTGPAFEGGTSISQSVAEDAAAGKVVFTASATDPTGGVTYALTGSSAFAIDADTGEVTVVGALDHEATASYSFTITATDFWGNTSTQAVNLAVTNVNEAPVVAQNLVDQAAVVGQAFSYAIATNSFTDPDANTTLSYSATLGDDSALPTWLSFDDQSGTFSATSVQALASPVTVKVTASDGSLSVSDEFTLGTVNAPKVTAITASDAAAKQGDTVTFTVTLSEAVTISGNLSDVSLSFNDGAFTATGASQPNANKITFTATIPAGDFAQATLSGITLANGATLVGNTSNEGLLTGEVGQTVTDFVIDNTAPQVTSASVDAAENGTTVATLTADETVTWALNGSTGDNALFTLDASGALAFTAAKDFEADPTSYNVAVTATDAAGNETNSTITVNLTNVNEAPVVAQNLVDQAAVVGQSFSYAIATNSFTDPDANTTLTYSATLGDDSALPSWLSFDANTGTFSATSMQALANPITVKVTASDGSLSVSDVFTLDSVTPPSFSTNLNGVTNLDVRSNLVLTASENIALTNAAGTYSIVITNDANGNGKDGYYGTLGETEANTQTIEVTVGGTSPTATVNGTTVALSELLTVTDNRLVINPYYDLDFSNNYHVEVDAGMFVGETSGQGNFALAAADATFATVTPNTTGSGSARVSGAAASQIMVDADGSLAASKKWIGLDNVGNTGAGAAVDMGSLSADAYGLVLTDRNSNPITVDSLNIGTWDLWAAFSSFEDNDLIYIDNHVFDKSGDWTLSEGEIAYDGVPPSGSNRLMFDVFIDSAQPGVHGESDYYSQSSGQAFLDFYVNGEYFATPQDLQDHFGSSNPAVIVGG